MIPATGVTQTERSQPARRRRKVVLVICVIVLASSHPRCGSSFQLKPSFLNRQSLVTYGKKEELERRSHSSDGIAPKAWAIRGALAPRPPDPSTTTLHLLHGNGDGDRERKDESNPARTATTKSGSSSNSSNNQRLESRGEAKIHDSGLTDGEKTPPAANPGPFLKSSGSAYGSTNDDDNPTLKDVVRTKDQQSTLQSEQEKDFSMWVEGLKQWPRNPGTSSITATSKDRNDPLQVDSSQQERPGGGTRGQADVGEGGRSGSDNRSVGDFADPAGDDKPRIKILSATSNGRNGARNATSSTASSGFPSALFSAIPALMKDSRSISSSISTSEKNMLMSALESSSGRYKGINPLSNFIKFEAILDMAAGVNNETEPYFSNVVAAADQLFKLSVTNAVAQLNSTGGSASVKGGDIKTESDFDAQVVDELLSNATTVEELIQREWYFGSLPFRLEGIPRKAARATNSSRRKTRDGSKRLASTLPMSLSSSLSVATSGNAFNDLNALLLATNATFSQAGLALAAESILKDATSRIEFLVSEASNALSPNSVQDLFIRASLVFAPSPNGTDTTNVVETVSNEVVEAARRVAKDRGLDVQFAADRAREATNFAASMAAVANTVLGAGYAYGSRSGASGVEGYPLGGVLPQIQQGTAKPLFGDYASARRVEPFQYERTVMKGAEMGALAGAIYENALERCHTMGHSQVANGTTANVVWMVTDSLDYNSRFDVETSTDAQHPILVRTITIRGFDASDESVDREQLLNDICTATSEPLDASIANAAFHKGLLSLAKQVYADVKKYIDWTSPDHRIVLNGHSVGGSLSVLILLLMTSERGADYVREKVLRVFTHGSPPVAIMSVDPTTDKTSKKLIGRYEEINCGILQVFGLPATIVFGYVQPYDPVIRLFSEYDALYPLVDDLGADEVTLYAKGPRRSLRPITRAIFQAWSGWPRFRDTWKGTSNQRYQSVGVQHILLPEPLRYLNDRFLSTNVGVPPVEAIVRISPDELLPALEDMFPLDTFQISLIPQAVRSFLHHFYPAYDAAIVDYASKVEKQTQLVEK